MKKNCFKIITEITNHTNSCHLFFIAQLNKQKEAAVNPNELAKETEQLGRELVCL